MRENGLIHKKKRNPQSLTKADKEAQTSDDLLKRDFGTEGPNTKWVTDITQLPTADGKLYISSIFDCFDNHVMGLCMDNNMRASLCVRTLNQAMRLYNAKGVILHSDWGSQYTSAEFRLCVKGFEVQKSMNSAGGRCHDNAKCESMWARFKEELIYGKINTAKLSMEAVKALVWRYFFGYWNNRRICSAIGGLPPAEKRRRFYADQLMPLAA
jgi:transposase InsO family protein